MSTTTADVAPDLRHDPGARARWRARSARLRGQVRSFLTQAQTRGRFVPMVDSWVSGVDPEFSRELGERGWVGMNIPVEHGGSGSGALERYVVTEELLAAGAPVAAHWIADRQIAPSLLRHGTAEQQASWLPGIAAGRLFVCLGMSEPEAGSDLAAVRTRAVFRDEQWILNGSKLWTSHAQYAHGILLLARTSPLGEHRHAGLSQFLFELPYPGVTVRPIRSVDGGAHFNEVIFDDVQLPPGALLGEEGNGWRQVTSELAFERSGPERFMSSVPLLRAWGHRLRSAAEPDRVACEEYARLVARWSVLREMSFGIAVSLAHGVVPDTDAALVKQLGGRFEQDIVETVTRCSGIEPDFEGDDPLAVMLAQGVTHAPTFTIRGGSNDILLGIVAKGAGLR